MGENEREKVGKDGRKRGVVDWGEMVKNRYRRKVGRKGERKEGGGRGRRKGERTGGRGKKNVPFMHAIN